LLWNSSPLLATSSVSLAELNGSLLSAVTPSWPDGPLSFRHNGGTAEALPLSAGSQNYSPSARGCRSAPFPAGTGESRFSGIRLEKCDTGLVFMDILKMLAELRAERQGVEEAILIMERLAAGTRGRRRGRPPKWLSAAKTETEPAEVSAPQKKRFMSPAARKRIAEAQKKRWATRKAQAKQSAT
jgi:hypothetical protein